VKFKSHVTTSGAHISDSLKCCLCCRPEGTCQLTTDCIETAVTFGPNRATEHHSIAVVHPGFSLGTAAFRRKSSVNSTRHFVKFRGLLHHVCVSTAVYRSDSLIQPQIGRDRFRNVSNLDLVEPNLIRDSIYTGTQYTPALDAEIFT